MDRNSEDISFIPLNGNPLDITFTCNTAIISTDNIHQAGSTTEIDSSEVSMANSSDSYFPHADNYGRIIDHDSKLSKPSEKNWAVVQYLSRITISINDWWN
jgi:hypothetical protein